MAFGAHESYTDRVAPAASARRVQIARTGLAQLIERTTS
jgi:hypothetical protein